MLLRKTLHTVNALLGTAVTALYAYEAFKPRIDRFAEKEMVRSAHEYVLVRLARGDYYKANGLWMMRSDYDFYKIIILPVIKEKPIYKRRPSR